MDPETAKVGIEFIYNMRSHAVDIAVATAWALSVYAAFLWIKNKLDK